MGLFVVPALSQQQTAWLTVLLWLSLLPTLPFFCPPSVCVCVCVVEWLCGLLCVLKLWLEGCPLQRPGNRKDSSLSLVVSVSEPSDCVSSFWRGTKGGSCSGAGSAHGR